MSLSKQTSRDRVCRIAFVGGGAMTREHIRAFGGLPDVEIVGMTNRTRDKAESLAAELNVPFVAGTVRELWQGTNADIVVMAVYEPAINAVAKACFQFPWSVLMEKPIGLDFADAKDVATAAGASGRQVWVGLNRRALASTRAVVADLADDPGPRFIHVQDQQSLATARALGHKDDVIRNWMFANSIHLVDYLTVFGRGPVTKVERLTPWSPPDPAVILAKVEFGSGDIGLYEAIWNGPGPWACTVSTPRRRWEMRPLESAAFQNAGERKLNKVETDPVDERFKPGFRVQAERVVAAWRGEASGAATLSDAMRSTELTHAIYLS
jgi:predicted dehydrogenase